MKIAVVGLQEAGLVTAACLADMGHQVVAFDPDAGCVASARAGAAERAEPGLASLIEANLRRERLEFSDTVREAIAGVEAVFVAVEPVAGAGGSEDCSGLFSVVEAVALSLSENTMLVLHAALPVGTGDRVEAAVRALRPDLNIPVVVNPPFQRPGIAVLDLMQADRIVIGATDSDARRRMGKIYRGLCLDDVPMVYTSRRTAEMIKYASNAYVAMKRTLVAELSTLCAVAGAEISDLARGVDLDKRVGRGFLSMPPAGQDAPTFPSELLALVRAVEHVDRGADRRALPTHAEPERATGTRN